MHVHDNFQNITINLFYLLSVVNIQTQKIYRKIIKYITYTLSFYIFFSFYFFILKK